MPEAAEVRQLTTKLSSVVGEAIIGVDVLSGRYVRSPIAGLSKLHGFRITGVACKGKLLFFKLEHATSSLMPTLYALSTLGMAGWWFHQAPSLPTPKPARLRLALARGGELTYLYFVDPRNFGTFKLVNTAGLNTKLAELGPDILEHSTIPELAIDRLQRYGRKRTIAEVMLDQRVFCGVGNYLRADGMYEAGVDPRTPALELSRDALGSLWLATSSVAYAALHGRGIGNVTAFFVNPCYGRKVDNHGNSIESYEDRNGRTIWWCPAKQQRLQPPGPVTP